MKIRNPIKAAAHQHEPVNPDAIVTDCHGCGAAIWYQDDGIWMTLDEIRVEAQRRSVWWTRKVSGENGG